MLSGYLPLALNNVYSLFFYLYLKQVLSQSFNIFIQTRIDRLSIYNLDYLNIINKTPEMHAAKLLDQRIYIWVKKPYYSKSTFFLTRGGNFYGYHQNPGRLSFQPKAYPLRPPRVYLSPVKSEGRVGCTSEPPPRRVGPCDAGAGPPYPGKQRNAFTFYSCVCVLAHSLHGLLLRHKVCPPCLTPLSEEYLVRVCISLS